MNKKIERERSRKRRSRDECPRRDSYNDGGGRASDGREGEFDANNGDERAYWANLKVVYVLYSAHTVPNLCI